MNSATLTRLNAKSGFPKSGRCRRQPLIPCCHKSATMRNSVLALPRDLTRAMSTDRWRETSLRFFAAKVITQKIIKTASFAS